MQDYARQAPEADSDRVLIDTRPPVEFGICSLPGSTSASRRAKPKGPASSQISPLRRSCQIPKPYPSPLMLRSSAGEVTTHFSPRRGCENH